MKHITNFFTFLVLFIASVMFLTMPVSAFEDDFNDDSIIDWTVTGGVWYTQNTSSINGADDYYLYVDTTKVGGGTETETIYKAVSDGDNDYISFNFKISNSFSQSVIYSNSYFRFNDNGASYNGLHVYILGTGTTAYLRGDGFSYTEVAINKNVWYEVTIEIDGSTMVITLYDVNGAQVNQQTISYTPISNPDRITISNTVIGQTGETGTTYFSVDNIYTSALSPSTISGIEWNKNQYIEGDTASYSWVLENSFWQDLIYKYRIQILKDGLEINTVEVSQAGTRYQDVDTAGNYEVKLQYSGLWPTNWQSIDSDSVNVIPPVDSYINVPQNAPIKYNFTATYLYGSTPITPIINTKELQNDYTYKIIDTKILPAATAGTSYTTNLSISSVGYYVVDLYDNGQGKSFATDTIQTNFVYIPPTDVVSSSYINTTADTYSFGTVISGSYAIDDTNYTDYHTRVVIYNVDKDVISFAYEPLHQIDNFDIPISDFDVYSDGDTSYPVDTKFLSGNNRVQLSAYNTDGTLNEVVAHKNITISVTDDEGYGLTLSKYTVEENEIFAIKAITPVQASIVIHPLTLMGISDTTILINGTTQMSYALGVEDTYSISLVSGGETKATQIIKVLEGVEIIAPVEEEDDVSFDTSFDSMLSSGAFVALLIIIACVGAFGKIGGVVGVFLGMVTGISISFLMGYLPAWILFIMVLALCVVFVSKLINSFGGGE